jgi:hypothetical protein
MNKIRSISSLNMKLSFSFNSKKLFQSSFKYKSIQSHNINKNKNHDLEIGKLENSKAKFLMDTIYSNFISLWTKSICETKGKEASELIVFQKQKLNQSHANQIEKHFMNELLNPKFNIYEIHLYLIESCFSNKANYHSNFLGILFLNKIFDDWHRQQVNRFRRNTNKNGSHLTNTCTDVSCFCTLINNHVIKAFEISVRKNISLLQSLNKIYKFEENYELLKPKIDDYFNKADLVDKGKVIGIFKLYTKYDINYDDVSFILYLLNLISLIFELINFSKKAHYSFNDRR